MRSSKARSTVGQKSRRQQLQSAIPRQSHNMMFSEAQQNSQRQMQTLTNNNQNTNGGLGAMASVQQIRNVN
jgi:hypothetical protein